PPPVIVPPDALQVTATATLSPACVRPYATNCCVWSGSSVTLSGEETICTTGLFGGVGSVTRTGSSHAANAAAAMARGSFMRARRCDSLNVNGIAPTPPKHERDRKSTRLNSSHLGISYAVFCLKKKKKKQTTSDRKTH